MSKLTVWDSQLVQQNIDKLRLGVQTNMECFHERDIELRAGSIMFRHSAEEVAEFRKCSNDIVYFVEKYVRFLTDRGRVVVKLRAFQKRILRDLAKEKYIEDLQDLGPENRNVIIMSSRQSGKCLFGAEITIKIGDSELIVPINLLYYFNKEHLTSLEKIKVMLMLIYRRIENW